jgi:hypothetical protein
MLEDGEMQPEKAPFPTWLQPLLASRFFEQCQRHINENRNEENHFCIDCVSRLCPNCVSEHNNNGETHNLLQIRHYVHSDVVRVNDVFKLLDVAKIQVYFTLLRIKKIDVYVFRFWTYIFMYILECQIYEGSNVCILLSVLCLYN